jgi:hypothetical protein
MFITEHYFASQSYAHVQVEFQKTYPNSHTPHMITTARLVDHFHKSGSMDDEKHCGRPCLLTNENVEDVKHG